MQINGRTLNKLYKIGAVHALYRENGYWFHALKKFPGALFDSKGYVLFKSENEYLNCSYIKHGPDPNTIHVIPNLSSLPSYVPFDPPLSKITQGN
jgi:5-methylcytosine-specific restriction protein A